MRCVLRRKSSGQNRPKREYSTYSAKFEVQGKKRHPTDKCCVIRPNRQLRNETVKIDVPEGNQPPSRRDTHRKNCYATASCVIPVTQRESAKYG
jgi:hypothetical protein